MTTMFKPRLPQLNWSLYATLFVGGALVCYILETPWWIYAGTLGLGVATLAWFVYNTRRLQIQQHGLLKARGLGIAWEGNGGLQARMNSGEFISLFESRMSSSIWRGNVLKLISGAKWVGVTDHFTTPYTFRWELHGTPPAEWDDDDRFCLYVACMACLPAWHPYQLDIDSNRFVLKNGAAYTTTIPKVYMDAPAITLQFWNYFQRHMGVLMDRKVEFNMPCFQAGLAEDVDIAVPSRFELAEGGSLNVAKEGDTYCVSVSSSSGQMGPVQKFKSANEFWWVWRNAIEHKPLDVALTKETK